MRRVLLRLEAELVMAMKRRGQGGEPIHEAIRPGDAGKLPLSAYQYLPGECPWRIMAIPEYAVFAYTSPWGIGSCYIYIKFKIAFPGATPLNLFVYLCQGGNLVGCVSNPSRA